LDRNSISADAGCNTIRGHAIIKGHTLTVSDMGMTEMDCMGPSGMHTQESAYAAALHTVKTWSVKGDTLTLEGAQTMVFKKITRPVIPDSPLEGTTWRVHTFLLGSVMASTVHGTTVTLTMKDGSYRAQTGCNTARGTYVLKGTHGIMFTPGRITKRACGDGEKSRQEQQLLSALKAATSWKVEGHGLTLKGARDTGLVLTTEEAHEK